MTYQPELKALQAQYEHSHTHYHTSHKHILTGKHHQTLWFRTRSAYDYFWQPTIHGEGM